MPIAMPFYMPSRRHWLMLATLLVLLSCSTAAFAEKVMPGPGGASVWTAYAFGNAQAVADAFRALANFTASSTFQAIVGFVAMAGVLAVGLSGGFSAAVGRKFIGYFVAVFLVTYIFFGVGSGGPVVVKVEVYDTVDGTWKAPVTVPAVVGIPASIISTAGHEITRQIEASFPTPDALKMSNGAPFNLAASLINDASKARITDPNLASSFAYYVQDCFTIGVVRGELQATSLLYSTDFMTDIKVNMPSVYVNTLLSDGLVGVPNVVSCTEAWTLLSAAVSAQGADAGSFLNNASAWASTPAMSVLNASADAVAQWASNNGITNGGSMIKQAAVLSTFNGAYKQAAAATGNSEFLTGLASAQAYETQLSGWIVGAEVFNRVMGYIFAIIQVFVYAITPLVLAAALVPGLGFALLKNFGQILLWLAIWQPMLAIVNFIILSMQQADLGGILNAPGGNYGFTLSSMSIITEKTSNMRAAAVFIGTMVPALSWALVKGSVDFSRVIGAAGGEKFAAAAANTMATGNYSLNQASMDSFTANKHSLGQTGDFGNGMVSTGQGGFMKRHELGSGGSVSSNGASVQLTPQAGLSAGDQTALTEMRGTTAAGNHAVSGGTTGSSGRTGSLGDSSTGSISSGTNASATLSAGASPQVPMGGRPGTAPGRGLDGGSVGGGAGEDAGSNAARASGFLGNLASAVRPQLGATLMGSAVQGKQNVDAHTASVQDTGSLMNTGSRNDTYSEGANEAKSAAQTQTMANNQSMTMTGIASLSDRVAAMAPAMQYSNFMNRDRKAEEGSALSDWASYRKPADTAVGQLAEQVAPQSLDARKAEHEKDYSEARENYGDELKRRKNTAETRADDYIAQGKAGIAAAEQDRQANRGKAHKDVFDIVGDKVKGIVDSTVGDAPAEVRQAAEDRFGKTLDAMRDGYNALTSSNPPATQPGGGATTSPVNPQNQGGRANGAAGTPEQAAQQEQKDDRARQDQANGATPVAAVAAVNSLQGTQPLMQMQPTPAVAPLAAVTPAVGADPLAAPATPSPLAAGADPFNNTTDPRSPEQMQAQVALAEQRNQELTRRQAEASDSLYTVDGLIRNASFENSEEQTEIAARVQDAQNRLA